MLHWEVYLIWILHPVFLKVTQFFQDTVHLESEISEGLPTYLYNRVDKK